MYFYSQNYYILWKCHISKAKHTVLLKSIQGCLCEIQNLLSALNEGLRLFLFCNMCITILPRYINGFVLLALSRNSPCNFIVREDWHSQSPTCFTSFTGIYIKKTMEDKTRKINMINYITTPTIFLTCSQWVLLKKVHSS